MEPLREGPAHRAQFVIELVGPRSVPAVAAAALLNPDWFHSLGQPELYAMSPSDNLWQRLTPLQSGSYDSLAICWDLISPQGSISSASGQHLLTFAEQFGANIGRRAMPMPPPPELDKTVKSLGRLKENLDIGVSLIVSPRSQWVPEQALWIQCARLGLEFSPTGSFDWRADGHPSPLFSVTPIGDVDSFSLGAVNRGALHEGVTIGFSVPLCPAPEAAMQGALRAADVIAEGIGGAVFDDSGRPLTERLRAETLNTLKEAVQMFEEVNVRPGSMSAIKIFG